MCCKDLYEQTAHDAMAVIFDWDECTCRTLAEVFDVTYKRDMAQMNPHDTPASLAEELMVNDVIFNGTRAERAFLRSAVHRTMRSILELAQEENREWGLAYTKEEMLDAFDKVERFCELMN